VVAGTALALRQGALRLLVPLSALALWFSLGGHCIEVAFLNGIRPRISGGRLTQAAARLGLWFVGGAIVYVLMATTARLLPLRPPSLASWWLGGLFFIGLELLVHATLALRGLPNFYSGRG
jgi:hypothetical protein